MASRLQIPFWGCLAPPRHSAPPQVNESIPAPACLKESLQHFSSFLLGFNEAHFPRDVIIVAKSVRLFLLSSLSSWNNNNKKANSRKREGLVGKSFSFIPGSQGRAWVGGTRAGTAAFGQGMCCPQGELHFPAAALGCQGRRVGMWKKERWDAEEGCGNSPWGAPADVSAPQEGLFQVLCFNKGQSCFHARAV